MATINFPDAWVPEAYELTGNMLECASIQNSIPLALNPTGQVVAAYTLFGRHPEIRRKPRLKRIVFTVAGEAKRLGYGDFFLDDGNKVGQWLEVRMSCCKYIPLTRTEEFE